MAGVDFYSFARYKASGSGADLGAWTSCPPLAADGSVVPGWYFFQLVLFPSEALRDQPPYSNLSTEWGTVRAGLHLSRDPENGLVTLVQIDPLVWSPKGQPPGKGLHRNLWGSATDGGGTWADVRRYLAPLYQGEPRVSGLIQALCGQDVSEKSPAAMHYRLDRLLELSKSRAGSLGSYSERFSWFADPAFTDSRDLKTLIGVINNDRFFKRAGYLRGRPTQEYKELFGQFVDGLARAAGVDRVALLTADAAAPPAADHVPMVDRSEPPPQPVVAPATRLPSPDEEAIGLPPPPPPPTQSDGTAEAGGVLGILADGIKGLSGSAGLLGFASVLLLGGLGVLMVLRRRRAVSSDTQAPTPPAPRRAKRAAGAAAALPTPGIGPDGRAVRQTSEGDGGSEFADLGIDAQLLASDLHALSRRLDAVEERQRVMVGEMDLLRSAQATAAGAAEGSAPHPGESLEKRFNAEIWPGLSKLLQREAKEQRERMEQRFKLLESSVGGAPSGDGERTANQLLTELAHRLEELERIAGAGLTARPAEQRAPAAGIAGATKSTSPQEPSVPYLPEEKEVEVARNALGVPEDASVPGEEILLDLDPETLLSEDEAVAERILDSAADIEPLTIPDEPDDATDPQEDERTLEMKALLRGLLEAKGAFREDGWLELWASFDASRPCEFADRLVGVYLGSKRGFALYQLVDEWLQGAFAGDVSLILPSLKEPWNPELHNAAASASGETPDFRVVEEILVPGVRCRGAISRRADVVCNG